jgi:N-acetylglucosaminyldiphosphoundecaprenol N-acetyl-beta-D-mannosaminyltransferase
VHERSCLSSLDPAMIASASAAAPRLSANVLGVAVEALDMEEALRRIVIELQQGRQGYVCAVDVHGILEAYRDPVVAEAFAGASITLPDGTPTVWVGRAQGHSHMSHVTGPALMHEVFARPEFAGYSHFFYGGKTGVAEDLAATLLAKFPSTRITGTFTPPYRDLTPDEEHRFIATINALKPDIMWVGISTPKQEVFMHRMLPRLQTRLMFGVGAAFDFHTGRIRDCAGWIKRAGFQWLHRLAQDPRRLLGRNVQNMAFLWYVAMQICGFRRYCLRPGWVERIQPLPTASIPLTVPMQAARSEP